MLPASLALAVAALAAGLVSWREIPTLLDVGVLELFLVLIVAVECCKHSNLFAYLVRRVLSRVRTERSLAAAAVLATGGVAACVTNDVALLLVVPFTVAFEAADPHLDPAPVVVLEIAAANLVGCLTPAGNPQNLYLYSRFRFRPGDFLSAQLPWVAGMAAVTLLAVPLLVRRRELAPPASEAPRVRRHLAAAGVALLVLEFLALGRALPNAVPVAAAVLALPLLHRRAGPRDFTLLPVFAALFVGVEGLRRSPLFAPVAAAAAGAPWRLCVAGALLSQLVSNVPAALLLAPLVPAGDLHAATALVYGVNAGGCGTPHSSLANLIGAGLLARMRKRRPFWGLFSKVSFAFLGIGLAFSLALLALLGG